MTPLELIQQGDQIIVRTNQEKVSERVQPTADLDIMVPAGASIEAHGRYGDFDIQGVNGNVTIASDNAGIRLENIGGNVQIDTHASDSIRLAGVKGNVELKGHGDDVELHDISGRVSVNAVYIGEVQMSNLAQPLQWEDGRDSLALEKLPGRVRASRGDFSGSDIVGPFRLRAHATDVQLSGVTQSLDLALDRGDVNLRLGANPPKTTVKIGTGDIDLGLANGSKFDLRLLTLHGDGENEYGSPLREESSGRGATIAGGTGGGPDLRLETGRGSIAVRKAGEGDTEKPAGPLKVEHE